MEKKTPGDNPHYVYTAEETFPFPLCLAKGFTMKDYNILMHCQQFFEINIVVRGSGEHYVGGSMLPARKGDVFIIPPDLRHGYVGSKNFDVYHLVISPTFIEKYSADLRILPSFVSLFKVEPAMREHYRSRLHLTLAENELSRLMPLLEAISLASEVKTAESAVITTNLAMILIVRLCSLYSASEKENARRSDDSDGAFMSSIAYIYENYYSRISVEELARKAGMSRTAYIRRFKSFTGLAPGAFILKQRAEAAAGMLTSTSLSVGEIAEATGFYDTAHFIRAFRTRYGMSPLEYRKSSR